MITQAEKNRIQSEAYERMTVAYDQANDWNGVGIALSNVIEDTKKLLGEKSFDARAVLHELDRTRWRRLQNTQFVYWANKGGHPSIIAETGIASGQRQYLRETSSVYNVSIGLDVLEEMMRREHELWSTPNEMVVYWRGWRVVEDPVSESVTFLADYCVAHIWDDQIHTEAKSGEIVRGDPWFIQKLAERHGSINLNRHRFDKNEGWIAKEHLIFPSVINPNIST